VLPPDGSLNTLFEHAVKDRPDILARRKALAAQERLIREAELRWLPMAAFNGYLRWSDTAGFVGKNWTWAGTVNLVFPLFDRGQRYVDLDERRMGLKRQREELSKAENELRSGLRQAELEVKGAAASLTMAEEQTRVARKTAAIVERTFQAGMLTSLEFAEADSAVRLAEANEEKERLRVHNANLRLRHAAGLVRP
jgi:outer membrane protein TolC